MFVPACRSSQFAREFQPLDSIATQTNEYKQDTYGQQTVAGHNVTPKYPYGYLLNFFFASKPNDPASPVAPNLAQMLEYLQVPSPFVGTETVLDPIKFKFGYTYHLLPGGPTAGEVVDGTRRLGTGWHRRLASAV